MKKKTKKAKNGKTSSEKLFKTLWVWSNRPTGSLQNSCS